MRRMHLATLLLSAWLPLTAFAETEGTAVDPSLLLGDAVLQLCESDDATAMAECIIAETSEAERDAISTAMQRGVEQLWREYYADIAEQLIRSEQPRSLLLAARLLRNSGPRSAQGSLADQVPDELHQRIAGLARAAAERGGVDRVVLWTLANNAFRGEAPELAATAVARLQALDPDNFAVWRLGDDPGPWDSARLAKAAQARYSHILYNERARADTELLAAYPIPFELKTMIAEQVAPGQQLGDRTIHSIWSFGVLMAEAIPTSLSFTEACLPERSHWREEHRAPCERIAAAMVAASDSFIDLNIGLRLQLELAQSESQRQAAMQARRRLKYQMEIYGEMHQALSFDAMTDLLMQPDTTEVSLVGDFLRRSGKPQEPPSGWLSPEERDESERLDQAANHTASPTQ